MSGRIVVLNGVPRAGKSSIVTALQAQGPWLNLGVDAMARTLPPELQPGIGLRPGGERPDLEPLVAELYLALYESIAAHARRGFDVVADVGHHDGYTRPRDILPRCARLLEGLPALLVGVYCPINIIMERRNADPQQGFYASGPGVPAPVQRWQDAVHVPGLYDLTVDSSALTPEACAAAILVTLANPPQPSAFAQLAS